MLQKTQVSDPLSSNRMLAEGRASTSIERGLL
jgi:hypothetical protein